jgi:hypothetical protein
LGLFSFTKILFVRLTIKAFLNLSSGLKVQNKLISGQTILKRISKIYISASLTKAFEENDCVFNESKETFLFARREMRLASGSASEIKR